MITGIDSLNMLNQALDELTAQKQVLQDQQEELQAQQEELQTQNEELQAQAEELQAQTEELRSAYETLERREREYRTLAENMPEVIARFDRQLRHTYINAYGARVYGVPEKDVLGKTSGELGKKAQLKVEGAQGEMDRSVLEEAFPGAP